MKKILLLVALCFFGEGFSQKIMDSIYSKKLNATRDISITLPSSYKKDKNKAYPVLIVLDGDYMQSAFDGALRYSNYWDDLPELIVVGVYQNQKDERYEDSEIDEVTGLPHGKGAQFFEFLGGELLPYIESKYKTLPFRIIAGHDVTAAFSNFYLYKDNPIFNAYINISPELTLDMEKNVASRLSNIPRPTFFYLAVADGDNNKTKEKIATLDTNIKELKNPAVSYKFDEIKNANHYSVVLHAIPNALYHIFSSYQPISNAEYKEKIVTLTSGYVDYLKNKYETSEKALGFKVSGRYSDFQAIEAAIVKNKANNEFELLAQLANKMFPKTMLGEYYLARYYEALGDAKRAAKSYQTAFTLPEVGDLTKDMMLEKADELKGQIKK
ncbi:alpha/beta hydrolase [Flavobacterium croceum]|uniref:Alpha/beta superfamily hydrolase n=1 Tax=Flavobacterium croceum DSM 17960 TaxID=1121886 RepID=A0A2S4N8W1_9FLAO|nr:alpha/beta hydrolase-fold protein [Flavobacterium croceum]POS01873.1 hypothetical protein Q361_10763 [Flavobacterium croceum DSM 17960]